jgi:hypothetical protein
MNGCVLAVVCFSEYTGLPAKEPYRILLSELILNGERPVGFISKTSRRR